MAAMNYFHPEVKRGKSSVDNLRKSLPYEALKVAADCGHSHFYLIQFVPEQPLLCGLCFFREGVEAEVPQTIHSKRDLADNGNPETTPKMLSHLQVIMGLIPPQKGQSLSDYRRRRTSPSREQYYARSSPFDPKKLVLLPRMENFSKPAPGLFPVTSALWKLMGYQPPLGRVLILGVDGRTEPEIAERLEASVLDIYVRMAKAIRVAVGFIPDDKSSAHGTGSESWTGRSKEAGTSESRPGGNQSDR